MKAILTAFWRFAHPRIVKTAAKVSFQAAVIAKTLFLALFRCQFDLQPNKYERKQLLNI